jgi:short-subunit dehydrogenase
VHLLINNAAISASTAFASMDAKQFDQILRVNFFAAVYACRAFLPMLEKHGERQILNVSSCFAWLGYPGKTAYAASKGALRAFSESLRLELAGAGVGVTVVYPGPMRTSLVSKGSSDSRERREREHEFLMRRSLPTERVARRCADQFLRNPNRIVIGLDYHLLDAVARISPALASGIMRLASGRTGF